MAKKHRYTFQDLEDKYSEENLKRLQRLSKSVSKEMSDAWLRLKDLHIVNLEFTDSKTGVKIGELLDNLAWNELNTRSVYTMAAIAQNKNDYDKVFSNEPEEQYNAFLHNIQEPIEALEKEVAERIQEEPLVCEQYDEEELEYLVKKCPNLLISNAADTVKSCNNWL